MRTVVKRELEEKRKQIVNNRDQIVEIRQQRLDSRDQIKARDGQKKAKKVNRVYNRGRSECTLKGEEGKQSVQQRAKRMYISGQDRIERIDMGARIYQLNDKKNFKIGVKNLQSASKKSSYKQRKKKNYFIGGQHNGFRMLGRSICWYVYWYNVC